MGKDDQSSGDPFHSGHTRVLGEGDIPTGPKESKPSAAPATFNAGDAWSPHTRALSPEMFDGLELAGNDNVPDMHGGGGGGGGGGAGQRSGKTMAMPVDAARNMLPNAPAPSAPSYPKAEDPRTAAMPPGHGGYPQSGGGYPQSNYPPPQQASPPPQQASPPPSSGGGGGGGGGGGIPYLETQAIESPMIQAQAALAQQAQSAYPPADEPVEKTTLLDTSNVDQYRQQFPQYGSAPQHGGGSYPPPPQQQQQQVPQQGFDANGMAVGGEKTVLIQDIQSMLPPHLAGAQQQASARGKLIIFVPETDPIEFELMPGITTVGRGMENHLVLGDPYASRKHMVITCKDGRYAFEDTGSDNGTIFNGRRGSNSLLSTGDILEIGSVQMRFVQGNITPDQLNRPAPSPPSARGGMVPASAAGPAVQPLPIQNLGAKRKRGPSKTQLALLVTLITATLGLIAVMVYIYLGRT